MGWNPFRSRALDAALDADRALDVHPSSPGERSAFDGTSPSASAGTAPAYGRNWTGSKYAGGYGATALLTIDYWTLRARSAELFATNLYARGLIRRLVTNEITTGLALEARPEEVVLGFAEDHLAEWSEDVENRFRLWGETPAACDYYGERTWAELQQEARREALVAGDVLVVIRRDATRGVPSVQLIRGDAAQNPPKRRKGGPEIRHGVELDKRGRQTAYHVRQPDGSFKRLAARGAASGKRQAFLLYGTDRRLGSVRGQPLLALVLQSIKEIDRYRDSTQRKAVLNSSLAMFVAKGEDKFGTKPLSGGATRRGQATTQAAAAAPRSFNAAEFLPGVIIDELQHGEIPHAFSNKGIDEKFGDFEAALISAISWANEVPPEILTLAFSNNYSASAAAINEFKIYLDKVRGLMGAGFCAPVYAQWLEDRVLSGDIDAHGLIGGAYEVVAAWISAEFTGAIKPSTDLFKQVRGLKVALEEGLIDRDRASVELTGTKHSKNVRRLARQNAKLAEALAPLAGLESAAIEPVSAPLPADAPAPEQPDDDDDEQPDDDDDGGEADKKDDT